MHRDRDSGTQRNKAFYSAHVNCLLETILMKHHSIKFSSDQIEYSRPSLNWTEKEEF